MRKLHTVAALFVDPQGVYSKVRGVELWGPAEDARTYRGPHAVVAHPPCPRWGRYYFGCPRNPHAYRLGEDDGCFAAALTAVRNYGGVLEHPAHSKAWAWFGLGAPNKAGGWTRCDQFGGHTCQVEQGHYGHIARKETWLYACMTKLPELRWGRAVQVVDPRAVELYGFERAVRAGPLAMKSRKQREATPAEFRDLLISIARTVRK